MVAREIGGMLIMALAAAGNSVCMTLCSLVGDLQLPYYHLTACAELLMVLALMGAILTKGELSKVQGHEWKWIVLRGAFGMASAVLVWLAVAEGAPLGDASALGSVNVVVSAVLGLVFLGEPLNLLHMFALLASLVGAILVSKPEAIFGAPHSGGNSAWFGHALALGSGISSGGLFIASRKSQGISPLLMACSVFLQEGIATLAMTFYGLVKDAPMEPLIAQPCMGMSLLVSFVALFTFLVFALSWGSSLCPAVASSTIFTSVSMVLGYVAQSVIHQQRPDTLTIVGALLMMLAVASIAAARWWQSRAVSARGLTTSFLPEKGDERLDECDEHGQSLITFLATEFSGLASAPKSIRQRRTLAAASEALQVALA